MWRGLGVVSGAAIMFLAGGAVYGYEALRPLLVAEGAFAHGCPRPPAPCDSQALKLNLVFTFAMASLFTFVLAFGFIMDWFGARRTMVLAVLLNVCGTAMVLVAPRLPRDSATAATASDVLWGIGFVLWGVSSPGVFSSVLTLSKVMPEYSSWIISFMIAVFDTASALFLFFKLFFDNLAASWRSLCVCYIAAVALFGFTCAYVLPGLAERDRIDELDAPLLGHNKPNGNGRATSVNSVGVLRVDGVEGAPLSGVLEAGGEEGEMDAVEKGAVLSLPTWRQDASTPKFILVTLFMMVFSLRNSFYIGSFADQVKALSPHDASIASLVFNIAFPSGGLVAFPICAYILRVCKDRDEWLFGAVWGLGLVHAVFNCVPSMPCQYVAMGVFPIVRTLKWSAVSDYVIKRFPMLYFGRLLGVINAAIGVSNLLVYPLYSASLHGGDGGKGNYLPANLAITLAQGVCVALPLYIRTKAQGSSG